MTIPDQDETKRRLDEDGFVVLEGFFAGAWLAELKAATEYRFALEGDAAGAEFRQEEGSRRLANLVNKGEVFRRIIVEPRLLACVELVLGPEFKLSSLNARSADPHNGRAQPLHVDMGAIADELGYWVCNAVWVLDDFTPDNGPLRIISGSHRWRRNPQEAPLDPAATHPGERVITGRAGTVIVMNAHAWHGGMENHTNAARSAIHAFYARRDKPQQQYQKQLVDADLQAQLTVRERHILALDDRRNDQVTLNDPLRSGFLT